MIKIVDLYSGNEFDPVEMAKKYVGVIFKAGQGTQQIKESLGVDVPRFRPDWAQKAKDAGLLVGWYWLVDSRVESERQVELCLEALKDDWGELGLWADVERPYLGMTDDEYWNSKDNKFPGFDSFFNFIERIRLATSKRIGVYTGPGAWESVMGPIKPEVAAWFAQSELWTAQYPFEFVPGVSNPNMYGAWKTWTLWQYRGEPDESIFNGTDEEFYVKYTGESLPPVDPVLVTPPDDTETTPDEPKPEPPKDNDEPGTELWRVRWPDGTIAGSDARASTGNFAVVRVAYQYEGDDRISVSSSVANFLRIPHEDVMYLQSLQKAEELSVKKKMNKWCAFRGRPYMYDNKDDDWQTAAFIRWGCLLLGNNLVKTDKRQVVFGDDGVNKKVNYEAARIVCLRKADIGLKTPETHPHLFHRMTSIAPNGGHGEKPFGLHIYSPLWSPLDWDKNGTQKCIALWVPTAWLERVE